MGYRGRRERLGQHSNTSKRADSRRLRHPWLRQMPLWLLCWLFSQATQAVQGRSRRAACIPTCYMSMPGVQSALARPRPLPAPQTRGPRPPSPPVLPRPHLQRQHVLPAVVPDLEDARQGARQRRLRGGALLLHLEGNQDGDLPEGVGVGESGKVGKIGELGKVLQVGELGVGRWRGGVGGRGVGGRCRAEGFKWWQVQGQRQVGRGGGLQLAWAVHASSRARLEALPAPTGRPAPPRPASRRCAPHLCRALHGRAAAWDVRHHLAVGVGGHVQVLARGPKRGQHLCDLGLAVLPLQLLQDARDARHL